MFVVRGRPMGGPATYISLHGKERRELKRVYRAHTSQCRMVLRAGIVLLAAIGLSNLAIARELDCDPKTVRKWRDRFAARRMEGLEDLPRPGRPESFSSPQRHEVFTLMVGTPPPPYTSWTLDLVVNELIDRGIVSTISRETISKWLREADLKPHRVKYWLHSKDPAFKAKRDRVVDLYINRPADGRVICIDEKTSIQALERCQPEQPARPGSRRKVEFEYKRHGTVNLLAAFDVHSGEAVGECIDRNDSQAFIAFLLHLKKKYRGEKLYLILDNGTTHRSKATTRFLARHECLVPVFLPTHASWLNQIELWFSALTRQALKHASFASREALIERIILYIETHNRRCRPYRWTKKGRPLQR